MPTNKRFQRAVDMLYAAMDARIERVGGYFRDESVPGKKVKPKEEQLQEFIQVRNSPEAWAAIIQQRGVKAAVKYNKFGEALLRRTAQKALRDMDLPDEVPESKPNPALTQALVQAVSQMKMQVEGGGQQMQQPQQQAMQPPMQPQAPMMPPQDPMAGPPDQMMM